MRLASARVERRAPRILLVSNPIAGGGMARLGAAAILEALSSARIPARSIDSQPGDARDWLPSHLDGVELVVVVGGDGAARQAASVLDGRDIHLWHSPSGTENLLARSLGMAAGAKPLLEALRARRSTAVDLGWARPVDAGTGTGAVAAPPGEGGGARVDHPFLLMASCGFDAEVVARLAASRRGAISHASYLGPILSALRHYRAVPITVEVDATTERSVGGVIVANAPRYALGLDPIRAARMDDGWLDASLLAVRNGVDALLLGVRCVIGGRPASRRGTRIRVECEQPVPWQIDGDAAPWGSARAVEFGLRRRALRILLPAPRVPGEFESSLQESLESPPVEWTVPPFDEEV